MKVLHILRQLHPGGIECWLRELVAAWPEQSRPEFHFALETKDFGSLAEDFVALGVRLHFCPAPTDAAQSVRGFADVLARQGPFHAVHCHTHYASPFSLALARWAGVPALVAHSHADFSRQAKQIGRRCYREFSRRILGPLANRKLAVSEAAARDLFGHTGQATIMPCGFAVDRFCVERRPRRGEFNVVHVGRLVPEKNHDFLLRFILKLSEKHAGARLWLIGDGPERESLERRIEALGLGQRVVLLGNRGDVPEHLAGADLFVFPSLSEGLGLAAVEAQAAGVPTLMASHLPTESVVFPEMVRRLALELPVEDWVDAALELRTAEVPSRESRRERMEASPFSIGSNLKVLSNVYAN